MVNFFIKLDKDSKREIVKAITLTEKMTSGEVRVHIQSKCKEEVFEEGKKVFKKLKMYKTKERNGVLIFIALESKRFAILGDIGIHERVKDEFWNTTRDKMAEHFKKNQIKEGIVAGVLSIGEKLKKHFPRKSDDKDELPNKITEE